MVSTTGKAHAVIPAFTFYRDRTGDEEEKHGKRSKNNSKSLSVIGVFICTLEHINLQSFSKIRFRDCYGWLVHSLLCERYWVRFVGVTSNRNGITIKSELGYNLKIVCKRRQEHFKKALEIFSFTLVSLSAWIVAAKTWSLIGTLLSLPGSRPPTSSHPRSAKRPTSGSRKAVASPVQGKGGKKSGKESSTSRPGSSVSDLVLFLLFTVVGGVISLDKMSIR